MSESVEQAVDFDLHEPYKTEKGKFYMYEKIKHGQRPRKISKTCVRFIK